MRNSLPYRAAPAALAPAVLLLAACAADGDAAGPSDPAGARAAATVGDAPRGSSSPTAATFPPETVAFMQEGLRQFSRNDPRWQQTRAQWLALGERETQHLVQTLWGALLVMQRMNQPQDVERARHELALVGEPSVPLLCGVLAAGQLGTAHDPGTGEDVPLRMDDLQRQEAAAVLTILGPAAVPGLLDAHRRAETKSGRRYAVRALGEMGDRAGPSAAAALASAARSDDDFERVEAVRGMQFWSDGTTRGALIDALRDPEEVVRAKAAESLALRQDASAAPSIRAAAEAARGAGKLAEARRIERWAERLEQPERK